MKIELIISNKLAKLKPTKKTTPLTSKNKPNNKTKEDKLTILKIPNIQNTKPIKTSNIPNTLIIILSFG